MCPINSAFYQTIIQLKIMDNQRTIFDQLSRVYQLKKDKKSLTVDLFFLLKIQKRVSLTEHKNHWLSKSLFERTLINLSGEQKKISFQQTFLMLKQYKTTKFQMFEFGCKCLYLLLVADTIRAEDNELEGADKQYDNKQFIKLIDNVYDDIGKKNTSRQLYQVAIGKLKSMLMNQQNNFFDDRFTKPQSKANIRKDFYQRLNIDKDGLNRLRAAIVQMIIHILGYLKSK